MKDKKYIEIIKTYCNKILLYTSEVSNIEEFQRNEEKVDAVLFNLEQIGETARKLSESFKGNIPSIKWNSIIGLRNLISHEYEGVDITIIYNVVTQSIPVLLNEINNI